MTLECLGQGPAVENRDGHGRSALLAQLSSLFGRASQRRDGVCGMNKSWNGMTADGTCRAYDE